MLSNTFLSCISIPDSGTLLTLDPVSSHLLAILELPAKPVHVHLPVRDPVELLFLDDRHGLLVENVKRRS